MIKYLIFIVFSLYAFAIKAQKTTPSVKTVGSMQDMGKDNFAPHIQLDTIAEKAHLFAMGPYGKMQGEITVFDGKPFFATAYEAKQAVVSQKWQMGSPFFVSANVENWQVFDISTPIKDMVSLQKTVADIAQKNGYDVKTAFPFRIKGNFDTMTTHIVTPRSAEVQGFRANVKQEDFTKNNQSGELLGFYSENHQGIFTGKNSFIHVHYLSDDLTMMAHLDKISVAQKSLKLYLPSQFTPPQYIKVNDTDFSKGRLGNIQNIDLQDITKFHGHLCDGLVVGTQALNEALKMLYPDGIIDRTNTRIVSKPSPCLTDVAIYLTGGRYQFNTFYVSPDIDGLFVVQRIDNGKAVSVSLNKGVKPAEIDRLGKLAEKQTLDACGLADLKKLEDNFSAFLLKNDPKQHFTVKELPNFKWQPELKNSYIKTDILNKNQAKCSH
ncbi:MAG: acetolactate decarboxylase [Saprospiraceae bacterium]|nr:acetolactate decarboxylase [Saprospiraceae bacterium]